MFALGHYVERAADVQVHRFVFRGVLDVVLADEEHAAVGIGFVDAHGSGGQRHSETGLFLVLKFVIDLDGVFDRLAGLRGAVVVPVLSVDDVAALDGKRCGAEQTDLLGLVVLDRSAAAERVKVIFGKRFLRKAFAASRSHGGVGGLHHFHRRRGRSRGAMNVAGDELKLRVLECRAAVVDERHPAIQIGRILVVSNRQNIIGAPGNIRRQVRGFNGLAWRAAIIEQPKKRGPVVKISGEIGEAITVGGHAGDDFVSDLPDGAAGIVGEQRGLGLLEIG